MEELFLALDLDWKDTYKEEFLEAFTHRSAVNAASDYETHNERLEFLGDAVLELVVTEYLFEIYPDKPEGDLTTMRSALVKGDHLATVAQRLDLGQYLILSAGERRSGGAQKDYLLANMVEAFIGALYRVCGQPVATKFIHDQILCDLADILAQNLHIDAKSHFQEIAQEEAIAITPHYEVLAESGKDHEKTFVVGAYLGEKKISEGVGNSKKEAQVVAAQNALDNQSAWNSTQK